MFRVIACLVAMLMVAGCSSRLSTGSLGFAGSDSGTEAASSNSGGGLFGLFSGFGRSKSETKTAAVSDKAPDGSWKKAPDGALDDRDFSGTRLNTDQALGLINAYRASKGLSAVKLHPQLVRAAKSHSQDLARFDRISHYGSDGSNPWDRVKRVGYKARLAAENVGTGQASIEEVMRGWKESESHNRNLLLPGAEHVGIALVRNQRTQFKTFWTLVLGAPV